ncbi:MAG: hypothetical protein WCG25_06525 [bacterium]
MSSDFNSHLLVIYEINLSESGVTVDVLVVVEYVFNQSETCCLICGNNL